MPICLPESSCLPDLSSSPDAIVDQCNSEHRLGDILVPQPRTVKVGDFLSARHRAHGTARRALPCVRCRVTLKTMYMCAQTVRRCFPNTGEHVHTAFAHNPPKRVLIFKIFPKNTKFPISRSGITGNTGRPIRYTDPPISRSPTGPGATLVATVLCDMG